MLTNAQPTIDMLTLSIRYRKEFTDKIEWECHCQRLNKKFNRLCRIIENDIGYSLQHLTNGKVYIPRYGIYFIQPNANWGYGRVYFRPTEWKLQKLQYWLSQYFYGVNLHSVELAWDFRNHCLSMPDYEKLALRIGASILPKSIVNPFTIAIIGKPKKCNDNAINGGVTVYVQSTVTKGSSKDANLLKRNQNSASSTIIYAKGIAKNAFLRVEHRLNKGKAKRSGIIFDHTDFTKIMDLPNLPFSHFFQFKKIDVAQFAQSLNPQPGIMGIRRRLWQNVLANAPSLTTADATRLIRLASRGSKELARAAKRATKIITMEEAINLPLPDDFYVSQRMGKHTLPDDHELPRKIELAPFAHEKEAEPARLTQGSLPMSQDMPQNRTELARTGAKNKNTGEKLWKTKITCPERRGEVSKRNGRELFEIYKKDS